MSTTYVSLTLQTGIPTAQDVAFVNAQTGGSANTTTLVAPYLGVFVPPANAKTCEILTPGAYFTDPGLLVLSPRTWLRQDEITFVNVQTNATMAIYSYTQINVLVRVTF